MISGVKGCFKRICWIQEDFRSVLGEVPGGFKGVLGTSQGASVAFQELSRDIRSVAGDFGGVLRDFRSFKNFQAFQESSTKCQEVLALQGYFKGLMSNP